MSNLYSSPKVVKLLLFPNYIDFLGCLRLDTAGVFSLLARNNISLYIGYGVLRLPEYGYSRKSAEICLPPFRWNGTIDSIIEIANGEKVIIRYSSKLLITIEELVEFANKHGHQVFYDGKMYTDFSNEWFDNL